MCIRDKAKARDVGLMKCRLAMAMRCWNQVRTEHEREALSSVGGAKREATISRRKVSMKLARARDVGLMKCRLEMAVRCWNQVRTEHEREAMSSVRGAKSEATISRRKVSMKLARGRDEGWMKCRIAMAVRCCNQVSTEQ